jgi:hypothetical protein
MQETATTHLRALRRVVRIAEGDNVGPAEGSPEWMQTMRDARAAIAHFARNAVSRGRASRHILRRR